MADDDKPTAPQTDDNPEASLLFEDHTHSFVLRIWQEEGQTVRGMPVWRGHITHVQSGQRRYIKHLRDILFFIGDYLPAAAWLHYGWCFLRYRLRHRLWRLNSVPRL